MWVYMSHSSQRPLFPSGTTRVAPNLQLGEKNTENWFPFNGGKSWCFVESRGVKCMCDPQLDVAVVKRFLFLWKNRKFCILHYKKTPCTQTKCTESIQRGGKGRNKYSNATVSYELKHWWQGAETEAAAQAALDAPAPALPALRNYIKGLATKC